MPEILYHLSYITQSRYTGALLNGVEFHEKTSLQLGVGQGLNWENGTDLIPCVGSAASWKFGCRYVQCVSSKRTFFDAGPDIISRTFS